MLHLLLYIYSVVNLCLSKYAEVPFEIRCLNCVLSVIFEHYNNITYTIISNKVVMCLVLVSKQSQNV